jgi:hypothetical protein
MEIKIIIIAGLIIILMYFTNVFVTLKSSKQNLDKINLTITDSIQKYLDMVPLLLLKLDTEDKNINDKREEWFNNWDSINKHWPVWIKLNEGIKKLYVKENKAAFEVVNNMKKQEQVINEAVHLYNEKLIKLEKNSEKITYKAIMGLTKVRARNYNHLSA